MATSCMTNLYEKSQRMLQINDRERHLHMWFSYLLVGQTSWLAASSVPCSGSAAEHVRRGLPTLKSRAALISSS